MKAKRKKVGYNGKIGDEKQGCEDEMKPCKDEIARYSLLGLMEEGEK